MNDGAVFEFDRHCLIVQLHQEPVNFKVKIQKQNYHIKQKRVEMKFKIRNIKNNKYINKRQLT